MATATQTTIFPTNKLTAAIVTNGLWELIEPALTQYIPYLNGKAAALLMLQSLLMGGVAWFIPDRPNVPVTP